MLQQPVQVLLARRRHLGRREARLGDIRRAGHAPGIAHQEHGLGDVQRGEIRIDRERHDLVGKAHFLVGQAEALASEQDARRLAGADPRPQIGGGRLRLAHRLEAVARPRRRRIDEGEVGHRRLDAVIQPGRLDHVVGTRGCRHRPLVRPAVARAHEAQVGQAEIGHRPRHHADILTELGLHEHDGRPGLGLLVGRLVLGHAGDILCSAR